MLTLNNIFNKFKDLLLTINFNDVKVANVS